MPNLYYAIDRGQVIVEAGKVYERVGQVQGVVNDDAPDVGNLNSGYTYSTPDDQGVTVYTPAQRAVSVYVYGGSFQTSGHSLTLRFTAPAPGVIRVHGGSSYSWYLNGVNQGTPGTTEATAKFLNLDTGDEIATTNGAVIATFTWRFLPFVYPII